MPKHTTNDPVSAPKSNLHKIRVDRGLTNRELAELVGMSRRQIEYLDGNIGKMNKAAAETAIRIADALGCDVRELMD